MYLHIFALVTFGTFPAAGQIFIDFPFTGFLKQQIVKSLKRLSNQDLHMQIWRQQNKPCNTELMYSAYCFHCIWSWLPYCIDDEQSANRPSTPWVRKCSDLIHLILLLHIRHIVPCLARQAGGGNENMDISIQWLYTLLWITIIMYYNVLHRQTHTVRYCFFVLYILCISKQRGKHNNTIVTLVFLIILWQSPFQNEEFWSCKRISLDITSHRHDTFS